MREDAIVLGIETSCDETAVALVRADRHVLSAPLFSQLAEHAPYGGVVPEIAARAHVEKLDLLIEQAISETGLQLADLAGVAATAGPGLIGGLMVGLLTGKKVYVFAARGGLYQGTPLDTSAAWVRDILGFIGLTDVEFVYAEGLAMGEQSKQAGVAAAEAATDHHDTSHGGTLGPRRR